MIIWPTPIYKKGEIVIYNSKIYCIEAENEYYNEVALPFWYILCDFYPILQQPVHHNVTEDNIISLYDIVKYLREYNADIISNIVEFLYIDEYEMKDFVYTYIHSALAGKKYRLSTSPCKILPQYQSYLL